MQTFCVIQGDATDVPVYIKNPVNLVIDRVVFTCKSLNIQEDLIPGEVDGDKYNDDE